jgi:3-isopropylmalate dehydrogenase
LISGLDILIIRELTGDIYFGQPRGRRVATDGHFPGAEEAFDTMRYSRPEIERIAHVAFQAARKRKASACYQRGQGQCAGNLPVLERRGHGSRPAIPGCGTGPHVRRQCSHATGQGAQAFDVVVTGNMFGDILSDEASMLTGSIGMLPSASLNSSNQGLYEPSHGSAPDIAGKGIANPLATILSAAMMLRFSLNQEAAAQRIEAAVQKVLAQGLAHCRHLTAKVRPALAPARWAMPLSRPCKGLVYNPAYANESPRCSCYCPSAAEQVRGSVTRRLSLRPPRRQPLKAN